MTLSERSKSIVEAEVRHFCDVEKSIQIGRKAFGIVYDNPELYARTTNCGIATALVMHNLAEYHGMPTERICTTPINSMVDESSRPFSHALLRQNDTVIDPTYAQLYAFAGAPRPFNNPSTSAYDNENNLTLFVDLNAPDIALEPLVDTLVSMSRENKHAPFAPLRGLTNTAVRSIVYRIYDPENCIPFDVESYQKSFDYIQLLQQESAALRQKTGSPVRTIEPVFDMS